MMNHKYVEYTAIDFAMDDDFIRWVKNPTIRDGDFWDRWVENNPKKAYEISQAIEIIKSIEFKQQTPSLHEVENVWRAIDADLFPTNVKPLKRWKRNVSQFVRIAAILIIGFGLGLAFYMGDQKKSSDIEDELFVLKETPNGIKSTFRLPDGSIVKLNAGSKLFFSNQFGNEVREVELEGEAYFQVVHNAQKPFKVKSGNIVTKVLGTTFNVRAYPEENNSYVALEEGKVQVREFENGEIVYKEILRPSEMLIYNKSTRSHNVEEFELTDIIAWKDNALVFKNASFPEIKKKLERWYGVSIHANEGMAQDFEFTGKFYNESLVNVLDNISIAMGFTYSIENKNVDIKKTEVI